jgi:hypothetical protein
VTVHNHGSEEGEGLACPETRLSDGSLKGRCLMDNIEAKSADYARRIMILTLEGNDRGAYDLKSEWSVWRDTLTDSEKTRCVNALVAVENTLSDGALELLKVQDPEKYKTYMSVRGLGS